MICDFCGGPGPRWSFGAPEFELGQRHELGTITHVVNLPPGGDPEHHRQVALARYKRQLAKWAEDDARRGQGR